MGFSNLLFVLLAQLEERFRDMKEVVDSNSTKNTNCSNNSELLRMQTTRPGSSPGSGSRFFSPD